MQSELNFWSSEKQRIEEAADKPMYLKLTEGLHEITFKDDGIDRQSEFADGRKVDQRVFTVEVNGKLWLLSISKGISSKSFYRQLAMIGADTGSLRDITVRVKVLGNKMDRTYVVLDHKRA